MQIDLSLTFEEYCELCHALDERRRILEDRRAIADSDRDRADDDRRLGLLDRIRAKLPA